MKKYLLPLFILITFVASTNKVQAQATTLLHSCENSIVEQNLNFSPEAHDIDNDGDKEIFVFCRENNTNKIKVLDHNGNLIFDTKYYASSKIVVTDIDPNNSGKEIIFLSSYSTDAQNTNWTVDVLNSQGESYSRQWPKVITRPFASTKYPPYRIIVEDFNLDGQKDIALIEFVDTIDKSRGATVVILDRNANYIQGMNPFNTPRFSTTHGDSSLTEHYVADANGDGRSDIISKELRTIAVSSASGQVIHQKNFVDPTLGSAKNMAIANVDADQAVEIFYSLNQREIHIIDWNGKVFEEKKLYTMNPSDQGVIRRMTIVDSNNDGLAELLLEFQNGNGKPNSDTRDFYKYVILDLYGNVLTSLNGGPGFEFPDYEFDFGNPKEWADYPFFVEENFNYMLPLTVTTGKYNGKNIYNFASALLYRYPNYFKPSAVAELLDQNIGENPKRINGFPAFIHNYGSQCTVGRCRPNIYTSHLTDIDNNGTLDIVYGVQGYNYGGPRPLHIYSVTTTLNSNQYTPNWEYDYYKPEGTGVMPFANLPLDIKTENGVIVTGEYGKGIINIKANIKQFGLIPTKKYNLTISAQGISKKIILDKIEINPSKFDETIFFDKNYNTVGSPSASAINFYLDSGNNVGEINENNNIIIVPLGK